MTYRFADCTLNPDRHRLDRDGSELHVEPQVFALLHLLVSRAPALVSYDEMMAEVWKGRIVSDATVAARLSAARTAVGDDGRRQAIIRTVARVGVQMAVAVTRGPETPETPAVDPTKAQTIRYTRSRDGTAIAWAETGEGPPLLRAGHWLSHLEHDWSSPVWRPVLEDLGRGRRLIRYDPRGTGLSDRSLGAADVEHLADDLEAVADAAGLDRVPVYAISQSVPVALTFAARHPDRVSRLVLVNGFVQGSTARGDLAHTDTMVAMIRAGWGVPGSAFMKAVATLYMPRATAAEVDSFVEMQALSADPDTAATLRRIIGEIDVSAILPAVTAPALVICCAGDTVQSPAQSQLLARRLSDATFATLDSPNHVIVPTDPAWAEVVARMNRFLDHG